MTLQETFDTVARALVKQGGPSLNEVNRCAYRGENGARCAVGHLIPDDRYDPSMENESAGHRRVAPVLRGLGVDVYLAGALQRTHDGTVKHPAGWLTAWADSMRRIAESYGLSTAALDEALAARSAGA